MCETNLTEIRKDSVILESKGSLLEKPNHYVFVMIGGESPEAFLSKIGVHMVEKAITPVIVPAKRRAEVGSDRETEVNGETRSEGHRPPYVVCAFRDRPTAGLMLQSDQA